MVSQSMLHGRTGNREGSCIWWNIRFPRGQSEGVQGGQGEGVQGGQREGVRGEGVQGGQSEGVQGGRWVGEEMETTQL